MFSIWHWVIVLTVVGGVGYAIWRSRRLRAGLAVADGGSLKTSNEPVGLGGWLVLVMLGLIFGPLRVLMNIMEDIDAYAKIPPQYHIAVHVELTLNVLFLAVLFWTAFLFFWEKRSFPKWWKIMALFAMFLPLATAALISAVVNMPFFKVFKEEEIGRTIGAVIGLGLWWWYINVSVRVRNTFVK